MKKLAICALALGGFAASAQAADLGLDSMKDPLPDQLTWNGVTVYGTIDVGYAYQTHGVSPSSGLATGLEDSIWGSKNAKGSQSTLNNNGLSQSTIGVKVEEGIGMGWTAIGKVETGFNPLWGELSDGCASLARNNGLNQVQQTTAQGDSSRCGQAFNGEVYAGVSNAGYGTLTVGRQNSLNLNTAANYDPMALSYAFSILGYTGTVDGGGGDTELSRWDDSVKYVYQYGPVHASAMYSDGGNATGIFNGAYAGNVGATWKGFSVDAVYTKERGAVSASNSTSLPFGSNQLVATLSDNEIWQVDGKYVWDLGGGYKDEGPGSKITFYGGYVHIDQANPSGGYSANPVTIGGYGLATVTTNNFATDKVLETAWAGAKYEVGPWAFTGAYYHVSQNSFLTGAHATACTNAPTFVSGVKVDGHSSNCSGDFDQVAGLVDYTFNKHFDVYAGVTWQDISGGLASGYINTDNTFFMTGMRLKF
ncbi:MAG: porin [Rhodomicrobium sp.]